MYKFRSQRLLHREGTMHLKEVIFHSQKYPSENCYPFNLPLFHETKQLTFDSPVTLFVGENGTGKSTLL